jgi:hypothetical protein
MMVEARHHLEEVLGLSTQKTARAQYLALCLNNIKEGKSVPSSLSLVQKVGAALFR